MSTDVQDDRIRHLREDDLLSGSVFDQFGDHLVFKVPRVMTVDQSSADTYGQIVSYDDLIKWHRDQILARA